MTNPNDAAFPGTIIRDERDRTSGKVISTVNQYIAGLNKREYFAAMAMLGLLSDHETIKALDIKQAVDEVIKNKETDGICFMAVQFADTLIAELSHEKSKE